MLNLPSQLRFLDGAVREGMRISEYRAMILSSDEADDLIEQMTNYEFPEVGKWIEI